MLAACLCARAIGPQRSGHDWLCLLMASPLPARPPARGGHASPFPCSPTTPPPCHRAGLIPEVRRRRYFENTVDIKKRKFKESCMSIKRAQPVRSFSEVGGQEPKPFCDMFQSSEEIDIFF